MQKRNNGGDNLCIRPSGPEGGGKARARVGSRGPGSARKNIAFRGSSDRKHAVWIDVGCAMSVWDSRGCCARTDFRRKRKDTVINYFNWRLGTSFREYEESCYRGTALDGTTEINYSRAEKFSKDNARSVEIFKRPHLKCKLLKSNLNLWGHWGGMGW